MLALSLECFKNRKNIYENWSIREKVKENGKYFLENENLKNEKGINPFAPKNFL